VPDTGEVPIANPYHIGCPEVVRFEILTFVLFKIRVFWDVTLGPSVNDEDRSGCTYGSSRDVFWTA
jgi:hypothetical protein